MHDYIECILYDRNCINCGECDQCDLDAEKICDNCKKCLQLEADYLAIHIDGVLTNEEAIGEDSLSSGEDNKHFPPQNFDL